MCLSFSFRENNLNSLGLGVINTTRRGYPPEEGAHIALSKINLLTRLKTVDNIPGKYSLEERCILDSMGSGDLTKIHC